MDQKRNSNIPVYLFLGIIPAFFISCLTSSCGKSSTTVASGVLYQIINLSPDVLPVDFYIQNIKKNTTSFYYPTPSGYFSVTDNVPPFQIRSASITVSTTNFFSLDTALNNNLRYTLFITGLISAVRAQDTLTYILTRDTASTPTVGRGKIRFVNAAIESGGLDVTANGTLAFTNRLYKSVSHFIELPAGNYEFKIMPTGVPSTTLADLTGITVADGKIYTLYCRGLTTRTDSAAFGAAVLPNNP